MGIYFLVVVIGLILLAILTNIVTYFIFRRSLVTQLMVIVSLFVVSLSIVAYEIGRNGLRFDLLGLGVIVYVLLAIGFVYIVTRLTTKPLKNLTDVVNHLVNGQTGFEIERRLGVSDSILSDADNEVLLLSKEVDALNKRINTFTKFASMISDGDLTINVIPVSENDSLGTTFVNMLANLRRVVAQFRAGVNALTVVETELSNVTEATDTATQRIVDDINDMTESADMQMEAVRQAESDVAQFTQAFSDIASGAQEQAQEVQRVTIVVDQMSVTIKQVVQGAESAAQVGDVAKRAAEAGVESFQNVLKGMRRIGESVSVVSSGVQEMGSRSTQIGNIVQTIENIAARTELLALNASIEAARAGQHGKGFSVVANSVRKLSELIRSEIQEIAGLAYGVQQGITEITKAMDKNATEVTRGNELVSTAQKDLDDILQAITDADNQLQEIRAAAQRMDESRMEVVESVTGVSAIVEENTSVTQQMAATSENVRDNMVTVSTVSYENNLIAKGIDKTANDMKQQVDKVLVTARGLKGMTVGLNLALGNLNIINHDTKSKSIKIAYLPIADHMVLPISYLDQIEKQHGLPLQILRCDSWPKVVDSLKGEADGALILLPLALKIAKEIPLRIIMPVHRNGSGLVLSKSIKNVRDLRGKTIGIPHKYSNHNIIIYKALQKVGIRYDEVKVVPTPPPLMPYFLQRGILDGFVSAEPFPEVAIDIGVGKMEFLSKDFDPNHLCCVLVMRQDSLKQSSPEVVRLAATLIEAGHAIEHDPQMAAHTVSPFFGVDPQLTHRVLTTPEGRITYRDLEPRKNEVEAMARLMKEMDLLPHVPNIDTLLEPNIYQQAMRQLRNEYR
ncbi:MAG: hypothetical protein B6242_04860 [Anaerolineaceae bacterium 4572_78]|nr:MAG: hypothetical protein B6242_04860 [Anaerolineaceae bacterium 4572_78]